MSGPEQQESVAQVISDLAELFARTAAKLFKLRQLLDTQKDWRK